MIPRNQSKAGSWSGTESGHYYNNPIRYPNRYSLPISGTVTPWRIEKLDCAAVIKGDRKTPLPWSYSRYLHVALSGSYVDAQYDTNVSTVVSKQGCLRSVTADPLYSLPSLELSSKVYNKALSRVNDSVRGSLDVSIDLLQSKQAIRMFNVLATARSIVSIVSRPGVAIPRALRKYDRLISGTWKAMDKTSRIAANSLLEWKYGWKPLLSTVFDASLELKRASLSNVATVRGSASDQATTVADSTVSMYYNGLPVQIITTETHKCRVVLTISNQGSTSLARWTSLNPVSIGYELVPFSFVVDYFLNIGGYLRDLETSIAYANNFRSGFVSQLSSKKISLWGSGTSPTNRRSYGSLSSKREELIFKRTVLSAYPSPKVPTFELDLGSSQAITIAALLRQIKK